MGGLFAPHLTSRMGLIWDLAENAFQSVLTKSPSLPKRPQRVLPLKQIVYLPPQTRHSSKMFVDVVWWSCPNNQWCQTIVPKYFFLPSLTLSLIWWHTLCLCNSQSRETILPLNILTWLWCWVYSPSPKNDYFCLILLIYLKTITQKWFVMDNDLISRFLSWVFKHAIL